MRPHATAADNLSHMAKQTSTVDTVVNLCKRRGFVFPCGEIYGGTRSAWDYGPLGVELKENIKRQWWKSMVTGRDDVVGLDSSIILPRETWVASGHVGTFSDPLTECLNCHKRHRQDHELNSSKAHVLRDGSFRADLMLECLALNAVYLGVGFTAFVALLQGARHKGGLLTMGE